MLWHRGGPGDARPAPGVWPRAHFCTFVRSLLPLTSQFPLLSRPAWPAVGFPGSAPADLLLTWPLSARPVMHEEMCAHLEKTGRLSENMARPARGTRGGKRGSAGGPRPVMVVTDSANAVSFGGHQSLRVPIAFPLLGLPDSPHV